MTRISKEKYNSVIKFQSRAAFTIKHSLKLSLLMKVISIFETFVFSTILAGLVRVWDLETGIKTFEFNIKVVY